VLPGRKTARTIATVCVNGLEQAQRDPNIDSENMEVASKVTIEHGSSDRPSAKDEHLSGVGVLCSKTERRRILVVELVNVFVHHSPVKRLVG
jgi:hypothetical protein